MKRNKRETSASRLGLGPKVMLAAGMVLTLFASCGRYFTAEISGYVKDSESEAGIDGAVIRIYLQEPATADAAGFIVETASVTSNGNPGYFNHRIIWQRLFPEFGAEGDTNSVWLGITHEDYLSSVAEVRGVLSETVNFIPDVNLDRAEFEVPLVSGLVVDPSGDGINGVRVVLDIVSTDEADDYVTVTTTVEGEDGTYEFNDVSWRDDEAAGSGTDTEDAEISVDDDTYTSSDVISVLLSSEQEISVTDLIHAASDEFSTPRVWGRVLNVAGDPLNGVRVVLDLASTTDDSEDYVSVTATVDGDVGTYEFTDVTWTDTAALGSLSDIENGTISVDDNDYTTATTIAVVLDSDQDQEIATDFVVSRTNPTSFSTTLIGRCVNQYVNTAGDVQDVPAQGIEVTCTYEDDDGTRTLYDQTDANGEYSFFIQWTDATYGDFEDGGTSASADSTIPAGEDGLIVEVVFAAPFDGASFVGTPGTYEISSGTPPEDRVLKSWLDPNYAPDAVN